MSNREPHAETSLAEVLPDESEVSAVENPFYDKALDNYLQRSRSGEPIGDTIDEAAERFRDGDLSANELARTAIGVPILVGHAYVLSGEATKQEVLEIASELTVSVAKETEGKDYVGRLADAMEAYWQEVTSGPDEKLGIAEVEQLPVDPAREQATPAQGESPSETREEKAAERARHEHRLVMRYRNGDQCAFEQLWERYRVYARYLGKSYFITGAESQDLFAEAQFGFMKGVQDYKPERGPFRAIAELAMLRQVITAVKTANRLKHQPLNQRVSFDQPVPGIEGGTTIESLLVGPECLDPVNVLIEREDLERRIWILNDAMQQFTDLERHVFEYLQQGLTYQETADSVGVTSKVVDNASQRVKRKFEAAAQRAKGTAWKAGGPVGKTVDHTKLVEQFVAGLSPAEQKAREGMEAGLDPEEIAIIHGTTKEDVARLLRSARRKVGKAPSAEAA